MTVWSLVTELFKVSSTVDSEISTAVTELVKPSAVTAKADAAAVVEESGSLKVRTSLLPSVVMAAEEKVGAVPGTVELLVTDLLLSDAASSPALS